MLTEKLLLDSASDLGRVYHACDEQDRTILKAWLKERLLNTTVRVVFVKSDGSQRKMSCTLDPQRGAVYTLSESQKRHSNEVCVVWDCELQSWRSFRWDRLLSVEFSLA